VDAGSFGGMACEVATRYGIARHKTPDFGYNDRSPNIMEDHDMLCENCHGRRIISEERGPYLCPECSGRGETHCCDGLQEQPLPEPVEQRPIIGKIDRQSRMRPPLAG
jgi:hypothetical protein